MSVNYYDDGSTFSAIQVSTNGDAYVFGTGQTFTAANVALNLGYTSYNRVFVNGSLGSSSLDSMSGIGILAAAYRTTSGIPSSQSSAYVDVNVSAGGSVFGYEAIVLDGYGHLLKNHGTVSGQYSGLSMASMSDANTVVNDGTISGRYAIMSFDADKPSNQIIVENSGRIVGSDNAIMGRGGLTLHNFGEVVATDGVAIEFASSLSGTSIYNFGAITGAAAFNYSIVLGGDVDHVVVNDGTINGNILFAQGNDLYQGRGGTLSSLIAAEEGRVFAGAGNDMLFGGDGNEGLYGDAGTDGLYGGGGDDVLGGGEGGDYLYGESGRDQLYGEAGADALFGGDGDDRLYGQDGGDYLYGEAGNDQIEAGAGNDTVTGGLGNDTLYGETGGDYFYFLGAFGTDQIADFSRAQGDRIVFAAGEVNPQGGVGYQYYAASNTTVFSVASLGQVYVSGFADISDIVVV